MSNDPEIGGGRYKEFSGQEVQLPAVLLVPKAVDFVINEYVMKYPDREGKWEREQARDRAMEIINQHADEATKLALVEQSGSILSDTQQDRERRLAAARLMLMLGRDNRGEIRGRTISFIAEDLGRFGDRQALVWWGAIGGVFELVIDNLRKQDDDSVVFLPALEAADNFMRVHCLTRIAAFGANQKDVLGMVYDIMVVTQQPQVRDKGREVLLNRVGQFEQITTAHNWWIFLGQESNFIDYIKQLRDLAVSSQGELVDSEVGRQAIGVMRALYELHTGRARLQLLEVAVGEIEGLLSKDNE